MKQTQQFHIGTKAENLSILSEQGFQIPEFFCVSKKQGFTREEVEDYLHTNFAEYELFAVRSSSSVEDSGQKSFAGQFDTYLNVKRDEVYDCIQKVIVVTNNESIREYCEKHQCSEDDIQMNVIIQQMIPSEMSGVLFTANPQGVMNESVVVVGAGTGNLVVDDKIDTTTYYYNNTDEIYYYEQSSDAPVLQEEKLKELIHLGKCIKESIIASGQKKSDYRNHYNRKKKCENNNILNDKHNNKDISNNNNKDNNVDMTEYDIEFAIYNDKIYILQARQITTIKVSDNPIILDNSNIVESYPGITLPLTQSFIKEVYYKIFQSLLLRLTKNDPIVGEMDETLRSMVDVANGRVYYRISNWYDVILLLPFSKKIIPVWQEMLGVQTRTVSSNVVKKGNAEKGEVEKNAAEKNKKVGKKQTVNIGKFTRLKVVISFFQLLHSCPKQMKELDQFFENILAYYQEIDLENTDNQKLFETYQYLVKMVMEKWDITLVNDMYSLIYTGLLKAKLKGKIENSEDVAKQFISEISDIESMKPVKSLAQLAKKAKAENRLPEIKQIKNNQDYTMYCSNQPKDGFIIDIGQYIDQYGDRNIEELKLESKTFRTDPFLLMQRIIQFAENESNLDKNNENIDDTDENNTKEKNMNQKHALDKTLIKKLGLQKCIDKATLGIKNREKSRLYRGRLYGIMRSLMIQIGKNLSAQGKLENASDVFWLFEHELEAMLDSESVNQNTKISDIAEEAENQNTKISDIAEEAENQNTKISDIAEEAENQNTKTSGITKTSKNQSIKSSNSTINKKLQIIAERKKQYQMYHALPAYSRLVFADSVMNKNPVSVSNMTFEPGNGIYRGVACSGGVVEGEVLVIDQPDINLDTRDKILVTRMTDPGWVFLIADAKGIVAEKGSLLSHTAIISRELHKPAVVNVKNITKLLKNGDFVKVDGIKGEVKILRRE